MTQFKKQDVEKLSDSVLAILSQVRWKPEHKAIWNSLREFHNLHGGLTAKQIKLLNHIYSRYSK